MSSRTPDIQSDAVSRKQALLDKLLRESGFEPAMADTIQPRRSAAAPLSLGQERLWLTQQLDPSSTAYHIPIHLRLRGPLDLQALRMAIAHVVERHEALRSRMYREEGAGESGASRPVQEPMPAPSEILSDIISLEHLPADQRIAEARRLAVEIENQPFDLSRGLLLRARLLRIAQDDHVLALVTHHVCSDAVSNGILIREIASLYQSFAKNEPPILEPLPIQYADFAQWQRERFDSGRLSESMQYWREQIQGVGELQLPLDRARPGEQSYRGDSQSLRISPEFLRSLRELAASLDCTLYMVLLAAYEVLLQKYGCPREFLIGWAVAGRERSELQNLIGLFVNTLVVRADLRDDPTFAELVSQRIRKTVSDAVRHQDLPLEALVKELNLDRDLSRNPLFQTTFSLQPSLGLPLQTDGLTIEWFDPGIHTTRFDLEAHLLEDDRGLDVRFVYCMDLFEASTIERMLESYRILLEHAARSPQTPLSRLPVMSPEELSRITQQFNAQTHRAYPADKSVHELFEEQASRHAQDIALLWGEETLTYGSLNAQANRLAHFLRGRGVGPDIAVGLCFERSPRLIVSILAILKAGGAYVPLDPDYPPQRISVMLETAGVKLVLTESKFTSVFASVQAVEAIDVDGIEHPLQQQSSENPPSLTHPDDLAYIMFTSGSTGVPKGVQVPHRGIVRLVCNTDYAHFGPEETFLQMASVSFDASTFEIWGPLLHGGRLALYGERVPTLGSLGQSFAKYGVSTIFVTTALFNTIIDEAPEILRNIRQLLFGGERCSLAHVRKALATLDKTQIVHVYGPTECTTFATAYPIPREFSQHAGTLPLGRGIANTQVYILDESLQPAPIGAPGELYIGGAGVARGYLGDPELTAQRFVTSPFDAGERLYRSGDLARWSPDGQIEFLGRVDQQVKIRGFRVEPGEIEVALTSLPQVRRAFVLCREDTPGHKRLVAYVVPADPAQPLQAEELLLPLKDRLPSYMIPSNVVFMHDLPLGPTGKVRKDSLPAPEAVHVESDGRDADPRDDMERKLADLWRSVLNVDRVGRDDNFFSLGGDSITAVQLVARCAKAGLKLTTRQVFQHQTIAELAQVVAMTGTADAAPQRSESLPSTPLPLTPIQQWFFQQNLANPNHFNQAVLLILKLAISPARVQSVIDRLVRRHDSLRLRFAQVHGEWKQRYDAAAPAPTVQHIDLSAHDATAARDMLAAAAVQANQSLDIAEGPLLGAVLFDMPEDQPQRLLIVVHHLAIDAISWRILVEELGNELGDDSADTAPAAMPFVRWAEHLAGVVSADMPASWRKLLVAAIPQSSPLPGSQNAASNTIAESKSLVVRLDVSQTQRLLQDAAQAYRSRVDELLLTSIAQSISRWSGQDHLLFDVEAHGRDVLGDAVDLSRTVGWFTCIYPVAIELGGASVSHQIKRVRQQCCEARGSGLGYGALRYLSHDPAIRQRLALWPAAQIGFNYLGQFDASFSGDSPLAIDPAGAGPAQDAANRRAHLLDIDARVIGGQLEIEWTYNSTIHDDATIRAIAGDAVVQLQEIINHCCSPDAGGAVPADFPEVEVSQESIDAMWRRHGAVDDLLPLSPLQEGMLYQHIKDPAASLYTVCFSTDIEADLDEHAFRTAWQSVIKRHAALRTIFDRTAAAEPVQVILRDPRPEWESHDLRALPQDEKKQRCEQVRIESQRPFALEAAPPMRWRLLRLEDRSWRLIWSFHHILLDGWSMAITLRDVMAAYDAQIGGGKLSLPAAPSLREFARWMSQADASAARKYWTAALAEFESPTTLGIARRIPQPRRSAEHKRELPDDLSAIVREFASRHGLTLNAVIEGAWAILLARYSGERTVTFGETVSGRPPELHGAESMVGLLINTIPARIAVGGADQNVVSWFRQLQSQQAERRQFEHTPIVRVREWCGIHPSTPLFETLFVFENYPVDDALRDGRNSLPLSNVRFDEQLEVPFALAAVAPAGRIMLRALYDAGQFADGAIERLLAHLENLLRGIAAADHATLGRIAMIDPNECGVLVEQLNQTYREYPSHASVASLFAEQVRRTPANIAIRDAAGQTLTYAQLDARSTALAHALRERGVRRGDPVGLCTERGMNLAVGMIGILKSGGAYVPLDAAQPLVRSLEILTDASARIVVADGPISARFESAGVTPDRIVRIDAATVLSSQATTELPGFECTGEDLAYIMYTSGSTGKPKGVCVPHRAIARLVINTDFCQVTSSDHMAQISNAAFDAATFEVWGALLNGGTLEIISRDDALSPSGLASALRQRQISAMFVTAALFNQMSLEPRVFESVRTVMVGGEQLDPTSIRRVLESSPPQRLLNGYGPTENTTFSAWHDIRGVSADAAVIPIGRPIANSTCYVLDLHGQPCPVGVTGELFVGGAGVASGYLNRPELTSERFVPDPFRSTPGAMLYRTGDLARWTDQHQIECLGRRDHQVKLRGFRIELGEIEAAILAIANVSQAVVMCRTDSNGEKQLVACISPHVNSADVRSTLRERLPAYMVPAEIVALDALPLNANGKIDRKALLNLAPVARARESASRTTSGTESTLTQIWKDVLGHDRFGPDDNFFDVGGHSLRLMRVHARLKQDLGIECPLTSLFEHPSISALSRFLAGQDGDATPKVARAEAAAMSQSTATEAIAIIGVAGRFPGAADPDAFWRNLRDGVESIRRFTRDELLDSGLDPQVIDSSHYVPARAILEHVDQFDASFFGYTPREAELIDPQQRLFMECAWEALERAACDPKQFAGRIGVYAGCNMNTYLQNIRSRPDIMSSAGDLQVLTSSDKDFIATRTSYKLDLRGPAVAVQTACSTSLVAVHQACQSLLNGECDMALAGGASVTLPIKRGYVYAEQGIASPDGHCRTFDKDARGTVGGDGVAVVALKRLGDAVRDGDVIHAVIRGTAINNDGGQKVGFTAPSIEGQAGAISAALSKAKVDPASIDYIEAHGTGTELGDPIEIAALKRAMSARSNGDRCLIGSVKSNIGHLDAAAGATGLIKTVMAIRHGQIPPVLHFTQPNPKLELDSSPFTVADRLLDWPTHQDRPRRAGVSSFGMGGTNVHVVIEQAPHRPDSAPPARREQILLLSGRSPAALDAASARLAEHLKTHPQAPLADVAHTLRVGRRRFEHRRAVVAPSVDDAVRALQDPPGQSWAGKAASAATVAFLFPGQGTQHVAMGRGLYETEPKYRDTVDQIASFFLSAGIDVMRVLAPTGAHGDAERLLERTSITQAALFTVEVALARLWTSWGIRPIACVGHSIGEIAAAVVCESLTLEDGVKLVAARGRLMEQAPAGAMLAVPLPADRLAKLLQENLWISAINAPSLCTVSGTVDAIERLSNDFSREGIECRRLRTSGAFHSGLMDDAARDLQHAMACIATRAPGIPYVSNVTGDWITPQAIASPSYWADHVRQPVRFAEGISRILSQKGTAILLEVGPGHTLGQLARTQFDPQQRQTISVVSSMRHPTQTDLADSSVIASAIAQMAVRGVEPNWDALEPLAGRCRVELPTYPFERKRYWIERMPSRPEAVPQAASSAASLMRKRAEVGQWLYTPQWQIESRRRSAKLVASSAFAGQNVLLLSDGSHLSESLRSDLQSRGASVTVVTIDETYTTRIAGQHFSIDPPDNEQWRRLAGELKSAGRMPDQIVHAWLCDGADASLRDRIQGARTLGFDALREAVAALKTDRPLRLNVISRDGCNVRGDEPLRPEISLLIGLCRVLPQEQPGLACQVIDIDSSPGAATQIIAEMAMKRHDPLVAYRVGRRAVQEFQQVQAADLDQPLPLRDGGVYWITGGLGNVGLTIARLIAKRCKAQLVLSSRTGLPPREQWDELLRARSDDDPVIARIKRIRELESLGARVEVLKVDTDDPERLGSSLSHVESTLGELNGVVHAAGDTALDIFAPANELTPPMCDRHFAPKVHALVALDQALGDRELDFKQVTSSLASIFGGPKMSAYAAANAFMDALAQSRGWTSVNWDGWTFTNDADRSGLTATAMTADEGAAAFELVLRLGGASQVAVCTTEFSARWDRWVVNRGQLGAAEPALSTTDSASGYERPQLENAFVAPRNEVEEAVAHMWSELIGVSNIGAEDDFFQLGGHSLMATQLLSRIRDAFRVEMTLQQIFAAPTVSAIAQGIIAREARPGQAMQIAGLLKKIRNMSPAQREQLLSRQRGGTEKGAG